MKTDSLTTEEELGVCKNLELAKRHLGTLSRLRAAQAVERDAYQSNRFYHYTHCQPMWGTHWWPKRPAAVEFVLCPEASAPERWV